MSRNPTYYAGDLANDLIGAALVAIQRDGPSGVSIRSLARELGVSHAAPKSHFADKKALFAAISVAGFTGLGDALRRAADEADATPLVEIGAAYVEYALSNPGHFAVMWRPELSRNTAELVAARAYARRPLAAFVTADSLGASGDAANQAWALAHGWASLLLSGAFEPPGEDPLEYVRMQLARAAHTVPGSSDPGN